MASCSDEEFIRLFESLGAARTAKTLGIGERSVYARRNKLEGRYANVITAPTKAAAERHAGRHEIEIKNGTVLVGSDFHIWPGEPSTCLRAFKKFISDIKPNAIILNGDVMDFPRISRHPQNWETAPDPKEEIEAAQDHLNDMDQAAKRGAHKIWTLGNHDARLEALYANSTPQMKGMRGVHLFDFFPTWQKAMSCYLNENIEGGQTMVKHVPPGGGENATRNYVKKAGTHIVHGHYHRQSVQCISNYRRHNYYGVDSGMVADKGHAAFGYTQDAPLDWRSGFSLLTYVDGVLMPPELITKMGESTVYFRGEIIGV